MNFTDRREMFWVNRGSNPLQSVDTFETSNHSAGTFSWNNSTTVRSFSILLNGETGGNANTDVLRLTAARCWGDHCNNIGTVGDTSEEKTQKLWSDKSIWSDGVLPSVGENLYIPSSWHLYIDTDTPIFQYVEINGILEFPRNQTATLRSNWIFVRAGKIISGSEEDPVQADVTHSIILYGNPSSEAFAFSNEIEAGNKVLAITGAVEMHGYPKIAWTLLAQNVYPGESIIFVDSVDWSVGDEIVISPSGFDSSESEKFTIKNVIGSLPSFGSERILEEIDFSTDSDWINANKNRNKGKDRSNTDGTLSYNTVIAKSTGISKIILDRPISFYHAGAPLQIFEKIVDVRAEVGLLTRNVRIMADGNGWGCNTVVSDFEDYMTSTGEPAQRVGTVNLSNIQIDDCSQADTTKAALRIERSTGSHRISNSVFSNSHSWAVSFWSAGNINFTSNFIYNSEWKGVVAQDLKNANFSDNLAIRVKNRGFVKIEDDSPTCFMLCVDKVVCSGIEIKRNRASGCDLAAFAVAGTPCSQIETSLESNLAHSSLFGYIISGQTDENCIKGADLQVSFTGQAIGIVGKVKNFDFTRLMLVENNIGIAFKTVNDDERKHFVSQITDSIIVGRTQHSSCDGSDCKSSDCQPRKGIISSTSDNDGDSFGPFGMLMFPLYQAKKRENAFGHFELRDYFYEFRSWKMCKRLRDCWK